MRRHTKIDEQALKSQYDKGKSDREIAEYLTELQGEKISQSGVSRARHRLGLPAHRVFGGKKNQKSKEDPNELYQKFLKRNRQWKEDHPDEVRDQMRQYQKDNRERLTKYEYLRRAQKKAMKEWKKEFKSGKIKFGLSEETVEAVQKIKYAQEQAEEIFKYRAVPERVLSWKSKNKKNFFIKGLSIIGELISKLSWPWRRWRNSPKPSVKQSEKTNFKIELHVKKFLKRFQMLRSWLSNLSGGFQKESKKSKGSRRKRLRD